MPYTLCIVICYGFGSYLRPSLPLQGRNVVGIGLGRCNFRI